MRQTNTDESRREDSEEYRDYLCERCEQKFHLHSQATHPECYPLARYPLGPGLEPMTPWELEDWNKQIKGWSLPARFPEPKPTPVSIIDKLRISPISAAAFTNPPPPAREGVFYQKLLATVERHRHYPAKGTSRYQ